MENQITYTFEVLEIVEKALRNCFGENCPMLSGLLAGKNDKYGHMYRSVSHPERLAAVERKKIEDGEKNDFSDQWLRKNGILLKTGKALKVMLPDFRDHDIEVLSSYVADELRGTVATSEGIRVSDTPSEVYTIRSYSAQDVANSCMRDKHPCRFQIYDDIKDCRIVYVMDECGKYLIGRALIWDNVQTLDKQSIKIMDRVFCRDRHVMAKFQKWAREHGYFFKQYADRANCDNYIDPETGEIRVFTWLKVNVGFTLTENLYSEVPYIDTFCYCNEGGDALWSFDDGLSVRLQDTDGNGDFLTGRRTGICDCCGYRFEDDELHEGLDGNLYCDRCFEDRYTTCDRCGETLDRETEGYSVDGDILCENCVDEVAVLCYRCNELHYSDHMTEVYDGNNESIDLCEGCLRESIEAEEIERCPVCSEFWYVGELNNPVMTESNQLNLFDPTKQEYMPTGILACPDCAKKSLQKAA